MRFKITIQNLSDPTDHIEQEGEAIIAFIGKVDIKGGRLEHGMAFSGNKRVMAEIIKAIPNQINAFAQEEMEKMKKRTGSIITPDGKELNKN